MYIWLIGVCLFCIGSSIFGKDDWWIKNIFIIIKNINKVYNELIDILFRMGRV